MSISKRIAQSWLFAGGLLLCISIAPLFLYRGDLYDAPIILQLAYVLLLLTTIFSVPSTFLNWIYDLRGYAATQHHWMQSPNGVCGKMGYILTGSIALWFLLGIGVILAVLVIGGLMSLGQAAWST